MACGLKPLAPEMPAAPATRLRVLACSPRAGGNSDTAARLVWPWKNFFCVNSRYSRAFPAGIA